MLGKLIVVASTTLTFVASCGAPKDTVRSPEIGRPIMVERITADQIGECQDPNQTWPGEGIYYPETGEWTCERS